MSRLIAMLQSISTEHHLEIGKISSLFWIYSMPAVAQGVGKTSATSVYAPVLLDQGIFLDQGALLTYGNFKHPLTGQK